MSSQTVSHFLNHTYCHQCGSLLKEAEVVLLLKSPVASVVHVSCAECGGELLVTLTAGGYSMNDVQSDLAPEEFKRFFAAPPVSVDDVLDLHELSRELSEEEIWKLLRQRKGKSWAKKSKRSAGKVTSRLSSLKKESLRSPSC